MALITVTTAFCRAFRMYSVLLFVRWRFFERVRADLGWLVSLFLLPANGKITIMYTLAVITALALRFAAAQQTAYGQCAY